MGIVEPVDGDGDDDDGDDDEDFFVPPYTTILMNVMIACLIISNIIGLIFWFCQCKRAGSKKAFIYNNVESEDYDSEQQRLQKK